MTYTTSHPPPMLDAFHAWNPAGATAPPVLNDCNRSPRVLPQIVLTGIENYYGLPDQVAEAVPKTYGIGTVRNPPRQQGKTMVYEGVIEASTRYSMAAQLKLMGVGFGDREVEGVMTVTPWTTNGGASGGIVWTYSALVTAFTPDKAWDLSEEGLFKLGFTLVMNMSDPCFYTSGATYP